MKDEPNIYIQPALRKKFRHLYSDRRIVLMTAPSGSGKTVVARELLKDRKYLELSAADGRFVPPDSPQEVLFIDDVQELLSAVEQQALCSYIRDNSKTHFVLASRGGVTPGWLLQFEFAGLVGTLGVEDFRFDRENLREYLAQNGRTVTDSVLDAILKNNMGYPLAVVTLPRRMETHGGFNTACEAAGRYEIYRFLDHAVLDRFNTEVKAFCLEMSLFDSFTTELARMVSGNSQARGLVEEVKLRTGFMISDTMDEHRFMRGAQEFFRWKLEQLYTKEQICEILSRAGLFYELQDDYEKAMFYYSKAGLTRKVSRLLEKNAGRQVGMAHYPELSAYYHSLPESEILASPVLMQAMSMLCSLETDYEESENWYNRLKERALSEKSRELKSRVAWLDVCLPQRDVTKLIPMIPKLFNLLTAKDIEFDPMTVTNNLPSVMNGGKDYSVWSRQDKFLAQTIGHPLEGMLGKEGVGLVDCAVAESRFERGEDISTRIIHLLGRLQEIQRRGTPDMEFAVVGLAARSQLASGRARDAWEMISNLRAQYENAGLTRFLPNMDALLCRIALYKNDRDYVAQWYREKAPKDPVRIWVTRRYEYITEAMTLISMGENEKALMTLMPLQEYFESCHRHVDYITSYILIAIAGHRMGSEDWQRNLQKALSEAESFGFVRTVSKFGAAVLPLLEKCSFDVDKGFLDAAIKAAREQTGRFPRFLEPIVKLENPLTPTELQVLRMICADKSNQEIADALGTKLPTVKTQVHGIFGKLGVKRRSEAKTAAETLELL